MLRAAARSAPPTGPVGELPAQPRRAQPRVAAATRTASRSLETPLARSRTRTSTTEGAGDGSRRCSTATGARMELAFSLLLSLPGTPMLVYGDEIGMGDDLSLPGRDAVRCRCSGRRSATAGFSAAPDGRARPAADRRRAVRLPRGERRGAAMPTTDSLLQLRCAGSCSVRRDVPGVRRSAAGTCFATDSSTTVLAHRCIWRDGIVVAVHNLSRHESRRATSTSRDQQGRRLEDLLGTAPETGPSTTGRCDLTLAAVRLPVVPGRRASGSAAERRSRLLRESDGWSA